MAIADIKIDQTDIDSVAVSTSVSGDRLSGTVLENKQVFDRFPQLIATRFNSLCDYINSQTPEGDAGLTYTQTEIAHICDVLDCTESQITL